MSTNTHDNDDEQEYESPSYREVGERSFLEGHVLGFQSEGEQTDDGDYVEYGDGHYVPASAIHALSEHDYHSRVQVETVEGPDDDDTAICEDCGEEFKSVAQHQALTDCGGEADE